MTFAAEQLSPPSSASSAPEPLHPCVIVGGGISGLALAYFLKRQGIEALLLEKSSRPGGVIDTVESSGFLFERGPNTVLDKLPVVEELISSLGLADETIRVPLARQARYIWHGKRLHRVPSGPGSLLFSSLFSIGGKLRLLAEPFIPPAHADEPLRDFVIRRLGLQAYERAFLPMVQGLGAGDPARLSAAASFPLLKEFERTSGSVIEGFFRRAKDESRRRKAAGEPRRAVSMITFRDGLRRLPEALAAALGSAFIPNAEAREVRPVDGEGYEIVGSVAGEPRVWRSSCLALCGDAPHVASCIKPFEPGAAAMLDSSRYSPLAPIGLGIETPSAKIPPGFGFLAARGQGLRILGAIFNSNIFPGRAPQGSAALTVMAGGDLDPDAVSLSDGALADLLRADLAKAIGWDGKIKAIRVERYRRAIPQYGMDHAKLEAALRDAEARRPGLHFFGNWIGGTAIPDRIDQARTLARRLAASIANPAPQAAE